MFGSDGLLDKGRRTPANPLGRSRGRTPATSTRRGTGLVWPEREMDATERFDQDETELEDDGQDFTWTERHRRVY